MLRAVGYGGGRSCPIIAFGYIGPETLDESCIMEVYHGLGTGPPIGIICPTCCASEPTGLDS